MQPTFFSSVRTNLSRSISPHLASPTSPSSTSSSIHSFSSGRRSPQLRSRSSSPTPRRFASVLAYHATPPIDGHGKKRTASAEQGESEHHVSDNNSRETRDRAESPSQIAVRNLEESWRRFELEATTPPMNHSPSSSIASTHPTIGSPLSPSPLSKPPYRELIECTAFKDKTSATDHGVQKSKANEVVSGAVATATASRAAQASEPSLTKSIIDERDDISSHHPTHGRTDTAAISKPTRANADLLTSSSSSTLKTSSSTSSGTTTTAVSDTHPQSEPEQHQHQQHENMNTFLASAEARHILDMPSLLGKDPNMIPDVLAMPIPVQPRRSKAAPSSSSSSATAMATSSDTNTTPGSQLISELDAKAESAAKAMTKRYAAKNLNMTETEAHRMVQIMAAEIVTLHEERDVMLQKMEKAKREMLEAAKLLRMKANAEKSSVEEFQDISAEDKGQLSGTEGSHTMRVKNVEDNGDASDKKTHDASVYDKDEWRDRE